MISTFNSWKDASPFRGFLAATICYRYNEVVVAVWLGRDCFFATTTREIYVFDILMVGTSLVVTFKMTITYLLPEQFKVLYFYHFGRRGT